MDLITFREAVGMLPDTHPLPHYSRIVMQRLLACAENYSTYEGFSPHIRKRLTNLPDVKVVMDPVSNLPVAVFSEVLGFVSWMEDFTLFSVTDTDWSTDLPAIMDRGETEICVSNTLRQPQHPERAHLRQALVHDPALPLSGSRTADIRRCYRKFGGHVLSAGFFPSTEQLADGVRTWDLHAMSGDYFLWQWMWVMAAGDCVQVKRDDGGTAWAGAVSYGNFAVFTAYLAQRGDAPSIGTIVLGSLLVAFNQPMILTIPLDPKVAELYQPERYETYKRKWANSSMSTWSYEGTYGLTSKPIPPYLDIESGQMIEA